MVKSSEPASSDGSDTSIWLFAAGYFLAYAPYTALTKSVTSGSIAGVPKLGGMQILPWSTIASMVAMLVFLTVKGYWRFASRRSFGGIELPSPTKFTLVSGLATAAIIATTTLSYTLAGTSILVMMLFMRGGVLVLAPIVDLLSKRKVRWQAWLALGLSLIALTLGLSGGSASVDLAGATIVTIYLAAYFARLRLMSGKAKSSDRDLGRKFFVEEQMVATPAIVLFLVVVAALGLNETGLEVRRGFFDLGGLRGAGAVVFIGLLSQGTGVFGALVLLDGRENAFCVPVNRASSVLAGIAASLALWALDLGKPVSAAELAGALLLVIAIILLAMVGRSSAKPA